MSANLNTFAEKQASKAANTPAFSGFSLANGKHKIEQMLSFIRQSGFFFQYTQHDISHINAMLSSLDELVPPNTLERMTPADWLLVVLAIYFHDLGMLVTNDEFKQRYSSDFPRYKEKELLRGADGEEYVAKIETLPKDEAERFLYEEFVRHNHARRVAAWVQGKTRTSMGAANQVVQEVDSILKDLPRQFRLDLALVCESHHLDDLDRLDKYCVWRPYGNSDDEAANVHYAALLLRAADLLHITSDRTPSTIFRLIAPTDPLSQREWAKQMGVTRVRAEIKLNKDNTPVQNAKPNTIEVYGHFQDPNGFFGLTSFLSYAETQLQRAYDWSKIAMRGGSTYEFPWRYIDMSNIQVEGFLPVKCNFEIDQKKVLELLTGHALYNDANVVIRELVQNALDAVRLQALIDDEDDTTGFVRVHWDSSSRCLTVEDNGTGMTQTIIEKHLLKIGASRYKTDKFLKQYPSFSSISRFGIGILSTFMVADRVEITTCHPDEEKASQLMLRSVHGHFLVKLLDKESDPNVVPLIPHGTRFRIWIREKAELDDIDQVVRYWIVFPRCLVTTQTDDGPINKIGYNSPLAVLEQALKPDENLNYNNHSGKSDDQLVEQRKEKEFVLVGKLVRLVEDKMGTVTLAYCVYRDELFDDWHFLDYDNSLLEGLRERIYVDQFLGTCIEGVRVEEGTPGFRGNGIMAIANVCGLDAPKTNVARSGIEESGQRTRMLEEIYELYCRHIQSEFTELTQNRGKTVEWAVGESRFLLRPLMTNEFTRGRIYGIMRQESSNPESDPLMQAASKLPLLMVERDNKRQVQSINQLREEPFFWTIHAMLTWHAELLLKETSSQLTLSGLLSALGVTSEDTVQYPALPNYEMTIKHPVLNSVFRNREIDALMANDDLRLVDVRWTERDPSKPRWQPVIDESVVALARQRAWKQRSKSLPGDTWNFDSIYESIPRNTWDTASIYEEGYEEGWETREFDVSSNQCIVPILDVECYGLDSYTGVRIGQDIYLLPGTPLANYLARLLGADSDDEEVRAEVRVLLNRTIRYMQESSTTLFRDVTAKSYVSNAVMKPLINTFPDKKEQILKLLRPKDLEDIIYSWEWKLFHPYAWRREDDFQNV